MKTFRYFHTFCSLAIVLLIVITTFTMTIEKNMHRPPSQLTNWYAKGIGGAISSMKYNLGGYAGYRKVFKTLESGKNTDSAIHQALELDDVASDGTYTMGDLDIGYIDYCRAAFSLFGYSISSLLYFYFLLFSISVGLFYIEFRNNNIGIIALIVFLLSHYVVAASAPDIGYNLEAVHSCRFLCVLAILPLMHICMLTLLKKQIGVRTFITALIQSAIVAWVLYLRSSILWMVILLLVVTAVNIFSVCTRQCKQSSFKNMFKRKTIGLMWSNSKLRLWPILLALSLILLSKIIISYSINPAYKARGEGSHVVWHSIYLGLANHPEIRKMYSDRDFDIKDYLNRVCNPHARDDNIIQSTLRKWLRGHPDVSQYVLKRLHMIAYDVKDQDGYNAAFKWLHDHGKSEESFFTFGPNEQVDCYTAFIWFRHHSKSKKYLQDDRSGFGARAFDWTKDMRWGEYEKILGDVIKNAAISHPVQIFELVFVIKPIRFLYFYLTSYLKITHFPPMILVVFALIYSLFLVGKSSIVDIQKFSKLLLMIFAFSMIPSLVVYSHAHTIPDASLLLTMCIYWSVIAFLWFGYQHLPFLKRRFNARETREK